MKRYLLVIVVLSLMVNIGCEKSTFEEFPLPDEPYSERVPFKFTEAWYTPLGWLRFSWALDEEYLDEFHPGYSFNVYSVNDTFIASLQDEEQPFLTYVEDLGVSSSTQIYATIVDAQGNEVFRSEAFDSD